MKNTKKKGFTIVELVIVIAVIGILSAILIPTFSGLVKDANDVALQQNLRNAYVQYAADTADEDGLLAQEDAYVVVVDGTTATLYTYADGVYGTPETGTVSTVADVTTVTVSSGAYTSLGEFNVYLVCKANA